MNQQDQNIRALALAVINVEKQAVEALTEQVNEQFVKACHLMLSCNCLLYTSDAADE